MPKTFWEENGSRVRLGGTGTLASIDNNMLEMMSWANNGN